MSDLIFIIVAFLFEFVGPVLLAGLLVWGIWKFIRVRRLRKSLSASKGDAAAMQMEYTRIGAGVVTFLGWVSFPVVMALAMSMDMELGVSLVLASLCCSVILYGAKCLKSRYNRDFKEKVVRSELEKVFDDLSFQPECGLNTNALSSLGLFPSGNILCSDLITARYHGLEFSQCDIRVQESSEVVSTTEDGHEERHTVVEDMFQGRAMRFAVASAAKGPVQVIRRDFSVACALSHPGQWQRVETELAAFGERFEIFAHDPKDAMRIMTAQMIEGMYYLDRKLNVPLAFHFENGEMFVFMALTRDAFDVSGKKTLLEEKKLLEEDISLITGFLDTMYFKGAKKPAEDRESTERAEIPPAPQEASAGEKASSFFLPGRLARLEAGLQGPMRMLCRFVFYLPFAAWGISVAAALLSLPDGIGISFSITEDSLQFTDSCSTLAYVVVGAFFILPSAFFVGCSLAEGLNAFLLGGGRGIGYGSRVHRMFRSILQAALTGIPLWLHLLIINLNLNAF